MDRSVPLGGQWSIGLDGLLGLIPGIGDVIGGVISTIIIVQAHRAGVPRATLMRMVANVGIDSALGSIPLVGDLFDFAWKANTKNANLYRAALAGPRDTRRDWGFLAIIVLFIAILVAIPIFIAAWAYQYFF